MWVILPNEDFSDPQYLWASISSSGIQLASLTWTHLCHILLKRFPDMQLVDPMDQLQQLKQLTTVNKYIDDYENWMTVMKCERSYLPQEFFVDRFISGLKDNIKHTVQCEKPANLLSAYWYSRQYEKAYLSNTRRNTGSLLPNTQARAAPPRKANGAPRPRPPLKCWYCPDNWTLGHKCAAMQKELNAIQMQGNSDDEQEMLQALQIVE